MKIVKFLGGLGNQMFQYSFYVALNKKFNNVYADLTEFEQYTLHNGFELEKIFNIKLKTASDIQVKLYNPKNRQWIWRKIRRILNLKNAYADEKQEFQFDSSIFTDSKNRYLNGYWQHHDYVDMVQKELRQTLVFEEVQDEKNKDIIQKLKESSNSVSVHVRLGDYVGHPTLGGVCDKKYYEQAIAYAIEKIDNPKFIFFSNDIPWCKNNFPIDDAIFVDWNKGDDSFRDMQLMSLCNHNIIANSSFSWWGAWLNVHPDKMVIAPKTWIKMDNVDQKALLLDSFILL